MWTLQTLMFLSAVAAVCALVVGARRLSVLLAVPPILLWGIVPFVLPASAALPSSVKLVAVIIALVAIPFVLIRLLQGLVALGYGHDAAGHVAGVHLVRLLDGLAAGLLWLVSLPVRILVGLVRSRR